MPSSPASFSRNCSTTGQTDSALVWRFDNVPGLVSLDQQLSRLAIDPMRGRQVAVEIKFSGGMIERFKGQVRRRRRS